MSPSGGQGAEERAGGLAPEASSTALGGARCLGVRVRGGRRKGGRDNARGGRGIGWEESANFQFESIVGSSHGLRRGPHLSAAPAPALRSGPPLHCSRHSALARLGRRRRRPSHHGECGRSGGGSDSGVRAPWRHLRRPAPGGRADLWGRPAGSAGAPGPIRACGPAVGTVGTRRDTRNISLGLSWPPGTTASFILSRFAECLVCARHGARRWGPAGDQVETAIWGSCSRREVWLQGDV